MKVNKSTFHKFPINIKIVLNNNLYFRKTSDTKGKWSFRYQLNGRSEMGLGSYPFVDNLKANERAVGAYTLLSNGKDPLTEKHKTQNRKN